MFRSKVQFSTLIQMMNTITSLKVAAKNHYSSENKNWFMFSWWSLLLAVYCTLNINPVSHTTCKLRTNQVNQMDVLVLDNLPAQLQHCYLLLYVCQETKGFTWKVYQLLCVKLCHSSSQIRFNCLFKLNSVLNVNYVALSPHSNKVMCLISGLGNFCGEFDVHYLSLCQPAFILNAYSIYRCWNFLFLSIIITSCVQNI